MVIIHLLLRTCAWRKQKKIYKGDIEHKVSENTDSQYDPKFSCSFNIHKSGNDDKQNAYEYIQVEGELDIDYDLTFEVTPSDIPEKIGRSQMLVQHI